MKTKKAEVRYMAKNNCKQCHGKGVIIRTLPKPEKKFFCKCVKEVKTDEGEKPKQCLKDASHED